MSSQQEVFQKKAAIQKKINEKRVNDMYETQLKLREKFVKVNEFMKECLEKTIRAEEQIENETKQQTILRQEISEIEHDLNELSAFEAKFKEIIKEFQPYEDVFNEVIETSDTFVSFDDLMSKSDALSKIANNTTLSVGLR
jgi:chromosome segregation ATPase